MRSDPNLRDPTRIYLHFPATLPTKEDTNRKLEIWPSFPFHHCRRLLAGKPLIEATLFRRHFASFGLGHPLDFIPHNPLCPFRPSTEPGTALSRPVSRWKVHGFGSSISHRRRASIVTAATIGLSVVGTLRLELPDGLWLTFGHR